MNSSTIALFAACAIHTGAFLSLPRLASPSLGTTRAGYEVEFRIEEAAPPDGRMSEAGAPRLEEKKSVVREPPSAPSRSARASRPPPVREPEIPLPEEPVDVGTIDESVAVAPVVREPSASDPSVPVVPTATTVGGAPSMGLAGRAGHASAGGHGAGGSGGGLGTGTSRGVAGGMGKGQPVRLDLNHWTCRWPEEAQDEPFDEQVVVLRAVVAADGRLERAEIVSDPGYGFGRAVRACVGRARFFPAKDRDGNAIRAESPPIRVRFVR